MGESETEDKRSGIWVSIGKINPLFGESHPPASAHCLPPCSRCYLRLGSAAYPGPRLARAWPALVAAGRPQEGPDERCCREGGRLAVDQTWQGKGLGAAILRDASLTTLQAAEIAGIRAILVHALHERAAAFYRHAGFSPSPVSDTTLMLALKDARAARTNS